MQFRNVSPLGDLAIAGVGVVPHGETFTVTPDVAPGLVLQAWHPSLNPDGIYAPVDQEAVDAVNHAFGVPETPPAEPDQTTQE